MGYPSKSQAWGLPLGPLEQDTEDSWTWTVRPSARCEFRAQGPPGQPPKKDRPCNRWARAMLPWDMDGLEREDEEECDGREKRGKERRREGSGEKTGRVQDMAFRASS